MSLMNEAIDELEVIPKAKSAKPRPVALRLFASRVKFPLKLKEQVVGVIAIYKLLAHKRQLTDLDHRLLELLAGHAATALVSSRLYAQTDRKLKTWEGVMSLLRER